MSSSETPRVEVELRARLAGQIGRHQDAVYDLQQAIAATSRRATEVRGTGLVALDLERALVSLADAARSLTRAHRETER